LWQTGARDFLYRDEADCPNTGGKQQQIKCDGIEYFVTCILTNNRGVLIIVMAVNYFQNKMF
jgi:hypothetical protein